MAFPFLLYLFTFYCFLFIIVFDVMYMFLSLFVLCSKIAIKKSCLFSSLERFSGISRVSVTLVEYLSVCGVLSSSHRGTPHTIGAQRLNLGFFLSSCVWSFTFWRSYNILVCTQHNSCCKPKTGISCKYPSILIGWLGCWSRNIYLVKSHSTFGSMRL